jgi:hypothetical protein
MKNGSWPLGADPLGNPNDPRDALKPYNRQERDFVKVVVITILILFMALMFSGCTLIAAGIIGATIENEHRDWCQRIHNYDHTCWRHR